ncbi:hypothetical protein PanWU01x14_003870 [Parasponia andersonii]|uniref:Uncharacterized protein n=1 Tax=Parasponia andersonii TaxID=3476 RepID=A0A2P5E348_PARAD|nr:hypothetical protein PanWU01x14_003870 [Parasponia andersonii]
MGSNFEDVAASEGGTQRLKRDLRGPIGFGGGCVGMFVGVDRRDDCASAAAYLNFRFAV